MKMLTINMKANDVAEVLLYDTVGEDAFWGGGISAKTFREQIKSVKAKTLNLRINSPGGSVFEASAMMAALDEFRGRGRVEVDVDGVAASAASMIAMASDEIRMAQQALMMIHNAHALVIGTAKDMRSMADLLDKTNGQMLDAYERHSKAGRDQLSAWADAETWFTPNEAIDAGLAHSVTEGMAIAACANFKELAAKFKYKHVPEALTAPPPAEVKAWEETKRRMAIAASL